MPARAPFERWLPFGRQVARRSLQLTERDVLEIYCYPVGIPMAEAICIEARRLGSDTHITLMSDDLWFPSMEFLPRKWLEAPSPAEQALSKVVTASIYIGGLGNAAALQRIPDAKLRANGVGGTKQDAARQKHPSYRHLVIPIGWVCEGRASVYGLNLRRWRAGFEAALDADLQSMASAGARLAKRYVRPRTLRIRGAGTDLRVRTTGAVWLDDGIVDRADMTRGMREAMFPAGSLVVGVDMRSASGRVQYRDGFYQRGFAINGVRLDVERGRIVSSTSRTQRPRWDATMRGLGKNARIGWFSIGLNPYATPHGMDNTAVRDAIAIGIGPHPAFTRKGGGAFDAMGATIDDGRIEDVTRG